MRPRGVKDRAQKVMCASHSGPSAPFACACSCSCFVEDGFAHPTLQQQLLSLSGSGAVMSSIAPTRVTLCDSKRLSAGGQLMQLQNTTLAEASSCSARPPAANASAQSSSRDRDG